MEGILMVIIPILGYLRGVGGRALRPKGHGYEKLCEKHTVYWPFKIVWHRLNMELDLQSLFGLLCCTHWLRPRNSPLPAFGLIYEGAIGQQRKTTSLCDALVRYIFQRLAHQ